MEHASHTGEDQRDLGFGHFVDFADFNWAFCYALIERLHSMGLDDRVVSQCAACGTLVSPWLGSRRAAKAGKNRELAQSIEQIVGNPAAQSRLRQITKGFMRIALFALAIAGVGNDFEWIVQANIIDTAKLLVGRK